MNPSNENPTDDRDLGQGEAAEGAGDAHAYSTTPGATDGTENYGNIPGAVPTKVLSELELAIADRDRYKELALRGRADFDNYQKRAARDLDTERKYAARGVITDLLPVMDNLDRALASAESNAEAGGIVEGIKIMRKQFFDVLRKHGVEPIFAVDEPFDPHLHEAVMQQPHPDKPPMNVVQTVQMGYRMHDRILRPAQVIVVAPR